MTKNKILLLIGIVIIFGGFFAGMKHTESKVTTAIDEILAENTNLSFESYTFSMPSRRLIIKNLTFNVNQPDFMDASYKYDEVDIVLPWSLLFYDGKPGITPVASKFEAKNMTSKTTIPSMPGESITTAALTTYADLSLDPVLLMALFQNDISENWIEFFQSIKYSSSTAEEITIIDQASGISVAFDAVDVEDADGFQAALFEAKGINVSFLDKAPLLSIDSFSMENLYLPNELVISLEEISTSGALPSPSILDEFATAFFPPELPLIESLQIKNLQANFEDTSISLEFFEFNWPSTDPLVLNLATEKLAFPASILVNELGIALPGLETLELSSSTDIETDSDGERTKRMTFVIKDLADITANATILIPADEPDTQDPMMSFEPIDPDTLLANAELEYEDNGLLAYAFLNAGISSSEEVIPFVQAFLTQGPQEGKDAENAKEMTKSLIEFLENPKSLTISLNPEKPLHNDDLDDLLENPAKYLKITSTQGDETLNEALQNLRR